MYTEFLQANFDFIVEDVICSIIQNAKKTVYFEFVGEFVAAAADQMTDDNVESLLKVLVGSI